MMHFPEALPNAPPVSAKSRHQAAFVALGKSAEPLAFYKAGAALSLSVMQPTDDAFGDYGNSGEETLEENATETACNILSVSTSDENITAFVRCQNISSRISQALWIPRYRLEKIFVAEMPNYNIVGLYHS